MNVKTERREEDLKRNCLTIRWPDKQHRTVTDEAWRRRQSASELVREMVIEGLQREGVRI